MSKPIRQGDVVLYKIDDMKPEEIQGKTVPHGGQIILAHGEVTGHAHRINVKDHKSNILWELNDNKDMKILQLSKPATLTHEEHHNIQLPPGTYRVFQKKEYTPTGWRTVAD